jgi:glycosyltransferase involved in cell wall biosynthesis
MTAQAEFRADWQSRSRPMNSFSSQANGDEAVEPGAGAPRNVLLVTLVPPYPPTDGRRIHLWNLVRALCAEGWATTLVSLAETTEREPGEDLRYLCEQVEFVRWNPSTFLSRRYARRLAALFRSRPFNAIQTFVPELQSAIRRQFDRREFAAVICDEIYAAANLPKEAPAPVIVDTQLVAHELLARYVRRMPGIAHRLYARAESLKMRRWEAAIGRGVYALGATCSREAEIFRRLCPGTRVVPLPNVVDTAEYAPFYAAERDDVVLFSASFDWFPNQEAAEFFAQRILPELRRLRPSAIFRLAGRCRSEAFRRRIRQFDGVELAGFVPDMRREIARASLCAVPLRIGSGTRLKILEAAAMGKAVVSTSLGAEGLDFEPGEEIVIADDPERFALALAMLLAQRERRREIGQGARRRVERGHNLTVLRAALSAALDPLARPRVRAARGGA